MRRKLPSIMALQAFEASARLLSFSEAGRECSLTAGAIGRQVRILESELGIPLFVRRPTGLTLRPAGKAYLAEIGEVLRRTEDAGRLVGRRAGSDAGQISIATLPGFGARWLMPRYAAFSARHPDISVRFYTRTEPVAFDGQAFDAAIHFGDTAPAHLKSDWLMAEEQVAVCCPSLLHPDAVTAVEALPRFRLLHHLDRPSVWSEWLGELGVAPEPVQQRLVFEQMHLMIEATLSGLGMALLPRFMVQQELALGQLVEPFAKRPSRRCTYWLTYPATKSRLKPFQAFRAWLLEQAVAGSGPARGSSSQVSPPQPRFEDG